VLFYNPVLNTKKPVLNTKKPVLNTKKPVLNTKKPNEFNGLNPPKILKTFKRFKTKQKEMKF
jgi:hypothetical protein